MTNNIQTSIIFSNPDPAFGGADEEKLEDAKLIAPISLRSAEKLVTREDYISHLEVDSLVMHADVVGKENEPDEIFQEYGYFLPPLDTWIYVTPERENWAEKNPYEYNKYLRISAPYTSWKVWDYEDILISALNQTIYLTKYKKYKGYPMYVTIHEAYTGTPPDLNSSFRWYSGNSYIEEIDYTIDTVNAKITRIATSGGGRIPSGDVILRIRYIEETDSLGDQVSNTTNFKNATIKTFTTDEITLATTPNSLYPNFTIVMTNTHHTKTYSSVTDYSINYNTNKITRLDTGDIFPGDIVCVQYASNWQINEADSSEQREILDIISNKKMICVDIHLKDSVYTPFDVEATIYCYKNMRTKVINGLEDYIRKYMNLSTAEYNSPMRIVDIYGLIMKYDGVRYAEISYLGKNFDVYRKYVLDEITLQELNDLDANKVEHYISAKYNEIMVLAQDEYDGSAIIENKRHGLIFAYKDAT
jgi:hypothetical protein